MGIERVGLVVALLAAAGCTGKDAPARETPVAHAAAGSFETATFSLG